MAKEKNIKNGLLNQMNTDLFTDNQKIRQEMLSRNTSRVKRIKWIVIISWLLVIIFYATAAVVELNIRGMENDTLYMSTLWKSISVIVFHALFLIAIVLTISYFIRSRSLTLQQIQNRLAGIEEQLKKLSQ
jgi:magnesium-transporting ATPase (P-type)